MNMLNLCIAATCAGIYIKVLQDAMSLLNLSIAVTVAAVLVLLIKLAAGNRITPRGHMKLWILVMISFIVSPIAELMPESEFAVRNWLPQSETTTETVWVEPYENLDARGFVIEEQGDYYAIQKDYVSMQVPFSDKRLHTEFAATTSRVKLENWVWFGGAAAVGLWLFLGSRRQKQKIKALPDSSDAALLAELEAVKTLIGVDGNVKICIKEGTETTFLTRMNGRYVIALENGFSEAERRQVLAHELTHLKHGDLNDNFSAALILTTFWWNPAIWLAFRRFRRDMEVFCDYDAARLTGDKKTYAATLVKAAGTERFILGTTSFIGGEKETSARVKALAAFKKPKPWITAAALLALAACCVCFALNPVGQDSEANRAVLTQAYENLLTVKSMEATRTTDIDYGALSGTRTHEVFASQQSEEPLCILGTTTLENMGQATGPEDAAQTDKAYTFGYYLTGTRGGAVRTYIQSVDSAPGQGWIDFGSQTVRAETSASGGYDREPASYGQDDLLGNLRQCLKAAAESKQITRRGNEYQVTMPYDWELFCAIGANQGLNSVLASNGIGFYNLWSEDDAQMTELIQSAELVIEMDEKTMLPRGYTLSFTKTCELIRERMGSEDSLGDAVVSVEVSGYDTFTEPDYRTFGGKTEFQKILTEARNEDGRENEQQDEAGSGTQQAGAEDYALKLENWDFLLAHPDGMLTQAALEKLTRMFALSVSVGGNNTNYNPNTLYCFLSSQYDDPKEINLEHFLRYYPSFPECFRWTKEQEQKLLASKTWKDIFGDMGVNDAPTPTRLFDPQALNVSLEYYMGIWIQDIPNWQDVQSYIPAIDRYLNTSSDFGGVEFVPASGTKNGDTVVLRGNIYGDGKVDVVTLQEADGRYLIRSHRIEKA